MASDQGSSVVYLFDAIKPEEVTRVYLRIKPRKGRPAWCEGSINNADYRKRYNVSGMGRRFIPNDPVRTPTMGAWYRDLLGIERDARGRLMDTELDISVAPIGRRVGTSPGFVCVVTMSLDSVRRSVAE